MTSRAVQVVDAERELQRAARAGLRHARGAVRATGQGERQPTTPGGRQVDVVAVVATETVARDGGLVVLDGLRTDDFEANPVVPFAHQTSEPPVGKVVELWRDRRAGELLAGVVLHREDERSELVADLFASGFLHAFSVAFRVLRWIEDARELEAWAEKVEVPEGEELTWVATESELLETSVVSVPSDAGALAKDAAREVRRGLATARAHGVDVSPLEDELARLRKRCNAGDADACRRLKRRKGRTVQVDLGAGPVAVQLRPGETLKDVMREAARHARTYRSPNAGKHPGGRPDKRYR